MFPQMIVTPRLSRFDFNLSYRTDRSPPSLVYLLPLHTPITGEEMLREHLITLRGGPGPGYPPRGARQIQRRLQVHHIARRAKHKHFELLKFLPLCIADLRRCFGIDLRYSDSEKEADSEESDE